MTKLYHVSISFFSFFPDRKLKKTSLHVFFDRISKNKLKQVLAQPKIFTRLLKIYTRYQTTYFIKDKSEKIPLEYLNFKKLTSENLKILWSIIPNFIKICLFENFPDVFNKFGKNLTSEFLSDYEKYENKKLLELKEAVESDSSASNYCKISPKRVSSGSDDQGVSILDFLSDQPNNFEIDSLLENIVAFILNNFHQLHEKQIDYIFGKSLIGCQNRLLAC